MTARTTRTMTAEREAQIRLGCAQPDATRDERDLLAAWDSEREVSHDLLVALKAMLDIAPFSATEFDGVIHRQAEAAVKRAEGD